MEKGLLACCRYSCRMRNALEDMQRVRNKQMLVLQSAVLLVVTAVVVPTTMVVSQDALRSPPRISQALTCNVVFKMFKRLGPKASRRLWRQQRRYSLFDPSGQKGRTCFLVMEMVSFLRRRCCRLQSWDTSPHRGWCVSEGREAVWGCPKLQNSGHIQRFEGEEKERSKEFSKLAIEFNMNYAEAKLCANLTENHSICYITS